MAKQNDTMLGTEKISVMMLKMAIPSIIAQVINILYNIVDRIYIGHIPNASTDVLLSMLIKSGRVRLFL